MSHLRNAKPGSISYIKGKSVIFLESCSFANKEFKQIQDIAKTFVLLSRACCLNFYFIYPFSTESEMEFSIK